MVRHTGAVLRQLELAGSGIAASLAQLTGELRIAIFQTAALALVPAALDTMRSAGGTRSVSADRILARMIVLACPIRRERP
jgi:hypothetical protein